MNLIELAKKQWDRTAGIAFTLIGVICLIGGWLGVRGTPILAEQTRYIVSGGIGAVVFLGLGATLSRTWKGKRVEVEVVEEGFRWDGTLFPSLSAAATAIAGSRWNGPRFFGLRDAA